MHYLPEDTNKRGEGDVNYLTEMKKVVGACVG